MAGATTSPTIGTSASQSDITHYNIALFHDTKIKRNYNAVKIPREILILIILM